MPRLVRDARLETRTARAKLAARGKPYWRALDPGLHIGYRKGATGGRWVVRRYLGGERYELTTLDGIADDTQDANGSGVLDYAAAVAAARALVGRDADPAATGPNAVRDALDDYFAALAAQGKATKDARTRADALIVPKLGDVSLAELTATKLRAWLTDLAAAPARLRTREGQAQQYREANDADAKRRRQATANRTWTILRAALNHAWREGKARTDDAWRRVRPFKGADAARVRFLTLAEAKRLINASAPDFRKLVRGALETGARYQELARLRVADFNADAGTIHILKSKTGKDRHVILTDEGAKHFRQLTAGRPGDALIFTRDDGTPWNPAFQMRPMADAVTRAKISPPISFHGLRHTWASLAVMGGMSLQVVAKNLGHADTRMVEKHYGHLGEGYVSKMVREHAPRFGLQRSNVTPIRAVRLTAKGGRVGRG